MKKTLIALLCLTGFACKKDNTNTGPSKKELITASAWLYNNGGLADANGNILVDAGTILPTCFFDNSFVFAAAGTGTVNENANVCPGVTPVTTFNWVLSADEQQINITGSTLFGLSGNFKLREVTSTKLSLGKDTTITGFGTVNLVFNLKH